MSQRLPGRAVHLLTLNMADLKDAVSVHVVNLYGYTDNIQVYLQCC